ncbi:MAG: hypothetical protein JWN80_321 [Microbacteriaceae bacterium]|nr:hypothetical protein [Microbacteriaceae bacterium]
MEAEADKKRIVTIVVNTRSHEWPEKTITFEQIVELAAPGQPYDPALTLVEYSKGHGEDHSLKAGQSVEVKDGMVFDVEPANRS